MASGAYLRSTTSLSLAALVLVLTLVAELFHDARPLAVSALFLYYPLVGSIGALLPPAESFLGAAVLLVLFVERISFEYSLAQVGASPLVDRETALAASRLSRLHALKLGQFAALAGLVFVASALLAGHVSYVPVFLAAAILLMATTRYYSTK